MFVEVILCVIALWIPEASTLAVLSFLLRNSETPGSYIVFVHILVWIISLSRSQKSI